MKPKPPTEDQEQSAFVQWLRLKRILFTSIPNESKRSIVYGAKLKRLGMSKGAPDLIIFDRSADLEAKGYLGLAIEMKSMTGKMRPEQNAWLDSLEKAGWATTVCYGARQAVEFMESWGY